MAKKSSCPITRAEFREKAEPVVVKIGDQEHVADRKEFSTGSLGWYLNGKAVVRVGDKPVTVQIGLNLTIIGSKDLPQEPSANPPPAGKADEPTGPAG